MFVQQISIPKMPCKQQKITDLEFLRGETHLQHIYGDLQESEPHPPQVDKKIQGKIHHNDIFKPSWKPIFTTI